MLDFGRKNIERNSDIPGAGRYMFSYMIVNVLYTGHCVCSR